MRWRPGVGLNRCHRRQAKGPIRAWIGPKTLDAVHLASAEQLGSDLRGFVTYDERLAAAAAGRGFRVVRPA